MTVDKDKLRQLAEAATPGPWFASPSHDHYKVLQDNDSGLLPEIAGVDERANTAFIAAANPATVLALLDELADAHQSAQYAWDNERATAEVADDLREQLAAMTKAIGDALPAFEHAQSALYDAMHAGNLSVEYHNSVAAVIVHAISALRKVGTHD